MNKTDSRLRGLLATLTLVVFMAGVRGSACDGTVGWASRVRPEPRYLSVNAIGPVVAARNRAVFASRRNCTAPEAPRLVVAGGVGANRQLRAALGAAAASGGFEVFYPAPELCTDNGAMIAFAAARRLDAAKVAKTSFDVRPRWPLESIAR